MKKTKFVGEKRKKEKETHPIMEYYFLRDFIITENWWDEVISPDWIVC